VPKILRGVAASPSLSDAMTLAQRSPPRRELSFSFFFAFLLHTPSQRMPDVSAEDALIF